MAKKEEIVTPDPEYIVSLNENLKTTWQSQRDADDEALELICQEHEVDVPKPKIKDFKPIIYHAGTAQDALDRYTGLIDKSIWQVERGWGTTAETRSERAEDFFNLFFWDYEAREGATFGDAKEDVLSIGRG